MQKIGLQNEDQRTLDSVPEVICLGPERSDHLEVAGRVVMVCVHSASISLVSGRASNFDKLLSCI